MRDIRIQEIVDMKARIYKKHNDMDNGIYHDLLMFLSYVTRYYIRPNDKNATTLRQSLDLTFRKMEKGGFEPQRREGITKKIRAIEKCRNEAESNEYFNVHVIEDFLQAYNEMFEEMLKTEPSYKNEFELDFEKQVLVVETVKPVEVVEEKEYKLKVDEHGNKLGSIQQKFEEGSNLFEAKVVDYAPKPKTTATLLEYEEEQKKQSEAEHQSNINTKDDYVEPEVITTISKAVLQNCAESIKVYDFYYVVKLCQLEFNKKTVFPPELFYLYFISKYRCIFKDGLIYTCDLSTEVTRDDEYRKALKQYPDHPRLCNLYSSIATHQESERVNSRPNNDVVYVLFDDVAMKKKENKQIAKSLEILKKKLKKVNFKCYEAKTYSYSDNLLALDSKRLILLTTNEMSDNVLKLFYSKLNYDNNVYIGHNGNVPELFHHLFDVLPDYNLSEGESGVDKFANDITMVDVKLTR